MDVCKLTQISLYICRIGHIKGMLYKFRYVTLHKIKDFGQVLHKVDMYKQTYSVCLCMSIFLD